LEVRDIIGKKGVHSEAYYLVERRPIPVPESALGNAKGAGGRVPRRDSGHNSDPREDEEDRGVDARRAGDK